MAVTEVRTGGRQTRRALSGTERVGARKLSAGRRAYDQRRRARKLDADGKAYAQLLAADPCSYCDAPPGPDMAADHIVGLDAGGENVAENLTAACRPCNASKRDQPLLLWLAARTIPQEDPCPA
jgi:5-methylcytosine-specific restriction endonuclease McrA